MKRHTQQDLDWLLASPNRHVIDISDRQYPSSLRQLDKPPLLLFAEGNIDLLHHPQIAVIGSRQPSSYGLQVTQQLSQALCRQGLCITSGLALGIDGEAHRTALRTGGKTIAVLGSGLNRIYPAKHASLAKAIIEQGGLLISEYSLDSLPLPFHFPQRNRIISGLALGVLIVEARIKSGSFSTARHALDQGKDVFAVPGPITHPNSEGCHQLIQSGAKLVCKVSDILEELPAYNLPSPEARSASNWLETGTILEKYPLLQYIENEYTNIDSLLEKTGWSKARLSASLLELELEGYIAHVRDGYCRRDMALSPSVKP